MAILDCYIETTGAGFSPGEKIGGCMIVGLSHLKILVVFSSINFFVFAIVIFIKVTAQKQTVVLTVITL